MTDKHMPELIVSAAFALSGRGGVDVYISVPRPYRHHHAVNSHLFNPKYFIDQGFLTSYGRFVRRKEAAEIAIKSGQVKELQAPPNLFTEDLW